MDFLLERRGLKNPRLRRLRRRWTCSDDDAILARCSDVTGVTCGVSCKVSLDGDSPRAGKTLSTLPFCRLMEL